MPGTQFLGMFGKVEDSVSREMEFAAKMQELQQQQAQFDETTKQSIEERKIKAGQLAADERQVTLGENRLKSDENLKYFVQSVELIKANPKGKIGYELLQHFLDSNKLNMDAMSAVNMIETQPDLFDAYRIMSATIEDYKAEGKDVSNINWPMVLGEAGIRLDDKQMNYFMTKTKGVTDAVTSEKNKAEEKSSAKYKADEELAQRELEFMDAPSGARKSALGMDIANLKGAPSGSELSEAQKAEVRAYQSAETNFNDLKDKIHKIQTDPAAQGTIDDATWAELQTSYDNAKFDLLMRGGPVDGMASNPTQLTQFLAKRAQAAAADPNARAALIKQLKDYFRSDKSMLAVEQRNTILKAIAPLLGIEVSK